MPDTDDDQTTQPEGESSAEAPDGSTLDRRDLDDPQSPNHPMVPPHRVDAADDQTAGGKREGQIIHDDAIAAMKRGETVDLSDGAVDQGDVSGTSSAGAGANDDVKYEPPNVDDEGKPLDESDHTEADNADERTPDEQPA